MNQSLDLALPPMALPASPLFHEVDGARLAVRRAGRGPSVVLTHGMPTCSHLWDAVAPHLTAHFDVVAWDMLGFGASVPQDAGADISVTRQAALLAGLVDTLGLRQVVLVGHDIGGAVAQAMAVSHPRALAALVLVDSVFDRSWPIWEMRLIRRLAPALRRQPPAWTRRMLRRTVERSFVGTVPQAPLEACMSAWEGQGGVERLLRAVGALDSEHTARLMDDLTRLTLPTSVVWGADDLFQPLSVGRALAAAIAGAQFEQLEGCGHFVPWEQPSALASLIAAVGGPPSGD